MTTEDAAQLAALRALTGSLYLDHIERRPTTILVNGWPVPCGCEASGPDTRCDVGQSLYRLRIAELAGRWKR